MTSPELALETFVEHDCDFHAAGRLWVVPEVRYTRLPDGSTGLSALELDRIHHAIANEICGDPGPLSSEDLDFLCDVSEATLTELAELLQMDKSTLSRWRAGSRAIPHPAGWLLKRWTWFQLFGEALTSRRVALAHFQTDVAFLPYARHQAIKHGLTFAISPKLAGESLAANG